MSIQIDSIQNNCDLCLNLSPTPQPTSMFFKPYNELTQSAKQCSACQFLLAVISNSGSPIGGGYPGGIYITWVITHSIGGTGPKFEISITTDDWLLGRIEVCALKGMLIAQIFLSPDH